MVLKNHTSYSLNISICKNEISLCITICLCCNTFGMYRTGGYLKAGGRRKSTPVRVILSAVLECVHK